MIVKLKLWRVVLVLLGLLALAPVSVAQASDGNVVALFKLSGPLVEAPGDGGLGPILNDKAPTNMFDLLAKLRQARSDGNLRAVIFDIENAKLGFAQIQELRTQFKALQAAKKDVLIFCESLDNRTLLLGSAASKLVLMPSGGVAFTGLHAEGLYFKNLLDNIRVEADILHCGAFKSAGEPFYRTGPSPEAEAQTNKLLDSIFEQLIEGVAESRRLTPLKVRGLIDKGIFTPQEALEAKLVDKLQYREDFIKSVKRRYGNDTKVVSNYGKKQSPDFKFDNPFILFKMISKLMKPSKKSTQQAIAVVYVEGPITSGRSQPSFLGGGSSNAGSVTVRKAIADAAADKSVKALLLRVDSPGGSAIASEVICEATKRFKDSGRPFVVSMGNVAGSGGYYVAALADTIFAEPATITGSIGVVGGKIITKELWDWIGVTSHEYKRGTRSDMMNTNRPFTDEERDLLQVHMNKIYSEFKGRVIEGRGDRIEGELESLAGGRVYTGKQALAVGLIDRLGGFADAITFTAEKADLGSDYELRVFPHPKSFIEQLLEMFRGKTEDSEFASLAGPEKVVGSKFAKVPAVAAALQALRLLDPAKAKSMEHFLIHLQLLSEENVLLIGCGPILAPR